MYAANNNAGSIISYLFDPLHGTLTVNGPDVTGIFQACYLTFTPDQRFAYIASPNTDVGGILDSPREGVGVNEVPGSATPAQICG